MIKSVLQALHVMSCLKIPHTICSLLEKGIRKFYWGGSQRDKKIHWVSWANLCDRKANGGLGFRQLDLFNQALLAMQGWDIITNPNSLLARLYKALYFPNTSFLHADSRERSSCYWKGLLWGRNLLQQGLGWKVGNGLHINIRNDNWIRGHTYFKLYHPHVVHHCTRAHKLACSKLGYSVLYYSPIDVERTSKIPSLPFQWKRN